jgi:hypothetical protein
MRPSEWKLPPVAVLASVSGLGGVTWSHAITSPVLDNVFAFAVDRRIDLVGHAVVARVALEVAGS